MTPTQHAAANAHLTPAEHELPNMISVDDHVMEPKELWQEQLPPSLRERGPRTVRERVKLSFKGGHYGFERDVADGDWCDVWLFDDLVTPTGLLHAPAGVPREEQRNIPAVYEDFRDGTWDQTARLADMDLNHVDAAINYPNIFPRFAGQGFLERADKELALACLRIYNDWMIDDWCAGAGRGRLIPLTLVPLWDPLLAAEEVRRCAAKGSFAIAFSENVAKLGQPSLYSGAWDVLWEACRESDTSVSMHIGSSSSMPTTSDDAPLATSMSMYAQNAQGSLCDWVFSGSLERFPDLTIAFAESQVGWMPYVIERCDRVFQQSSGWSKINPSVTELPSSYVPGRVYGCFFDDMVGIETRDLIGVTQLLFETDYPHQDSTWPHTPEVVARIAARVSPAELEMMMRTNAIELLSLDPVSLIPARLR